MTETGSAEGDLDERLRIEGTSTRSIPWDGIAARYEQALVCERVGFECASGDWIERAYVGVSAFEILTDADLPAETTHFRLEAVDGIAACIPVDAVEHALLVLADRPGETTAGIDPATVTIDGPYPRFVSPDIVGPRAIKQLAVIEPLSLDAGEEPNDYESLPKRE